MSHLKTATTALTAAVLVGGIGLAFAQSQDPSPPAEPMTAAPAATVSEQTPADPNAPPPADASKQMPQQTPAADDPARTASPPDTTVSMPSEPPAAGEPAPRADRN